MIQQVTGTWSLAAVAVGAQLTTATIAAPACRWVEFESCPFAVHSDSGRVISVVAVTDSEGDDFRDPHASGNEQSKAEG